jgi:hypothetical protein
MKKHSTKKETDAKIREAKEPEVNSEAVGEIADVNSIQEFIELKKLQNRILGKMLEKINQPENQTKSNNK